MTNQREIEKKVQTAASIRNVELEKNPVSGDFDEKHLAEIHRRLFQDAPRYGSGIQPGKFRHTIEGEDREWHKKRHAGLDSWYVVYSKMDEVAKERLSKTLSDIHPDKLKGMKTDEFAKRIGKAYASLDYVHPFRDGNSRTLRTFTKQVAKEAGYTIEWEKFNENTRSRDELFRSRDVSVCELALPNVRNPKIRQAIMETQYDLRGTPNIEAALSAKGIVQPLRARDFERLSQDDALSRNPDLAEAYKIQEVAEKATKQLSPEEAKEAQKSITSRIQQSLNAGETTKLGGNHAPVISQPDTPRTNKQSDKRRTKGPKRW